MLRGSAFLIMWHDIAPEGAAEYHRWHSQQHMPERLGHPGFLRSRRGVNQGYDRQKLFTLYEAHELEAFVSPDYQRSLNGPTKWTTAMAPHFRNFLRCACAVRHSAGHGIGGALATLRARVPAGADEDRLADHLASLELPAELSDLVCGHHVAFARPVFSNSVTQETQLRPPMDEDGFDVVVLVESFGLEELGLLLPEVTAQMRDAGCTGIIAQEYALAHLLERSGE